MRRFWFLMALGLALVIGCATSSPDVRITTPRGQGTVQDQLDGVAAGYFGHLLGGN